MTDDALYRYRMDASRKWRERGEECPWLAFPAEWEVKPIPPFAGADVRFLVRLRGSDDSRGVSVYADFDNSLGCFDGPYWEAYPINDSNERVALDDVEGLIAMIQRGLDGQGELTQT